MNNEFQMRLDFLVNFVADQNKIKAIADKANELLKNIKPNINLNSDQIKQTVANLSKSISSLVADVEVFAKKFNDANNKARFKAVLENAQQLQKELNALTGKDIKFNVKGNIDTDVFNKLREAAEGSLRFVEGLDTKLKQAAQSGAGVGKVGAAEFDKMNKALQDAKQNLNLVATESEKVAKSIGESFADRMAKLNFTIQGVQQVAGAFSQFIEPYKEFDKQLRNIGTLGVKNFEEFRNAAIDVAVKVPDTVAGVTEAVYNAISSGAIEVKDGFADVEGGMKFIEVASKLAVAGLTDTNSAVQSLAANLNAYGESTEAAERYSDILFNTVNKGVTSIPELNATLANVIPTAAAFGVKFEEVSAAIAAMTLQGEMTGTSTTKIRQFLVELAKPGEQLQKIMREAGVSLQSLKTEGLQVTMQKLGEAMEAAGLKATQVFSSVEAAGAALALSGAENSQRFAEILNTYATEAIGSTQRAFEIANEGIGVGVQGVLNQIEAAFFKVFAVAGDGFVTIMDLSAQLAPTLTTFVQLGNVIPVTKIKTQITTIAGNFASLRTSAGATAFSIKGIATALNVNPVLLGITAIVTALGLFLTKTEEGQRLLKRLGEAGEKTFKMIKPALDGAFKVLGETVNVFINLGKVLYEWVMAPVEVVIGLISDLIEQFTGAKTEGEETSIVFKALGGVFNILAVEVKKVGDFFGTLANKIKFTKNFVIEFVKSVPTLIKLLGEYLSYWLNPKNWFNRDRDAEAELNKKFSEYFKTIYEAAEERGKAVKKNMGEIVKEEQEIAKSELEIVKEELENTKKELENTKKSAKDKTAAKEKSLLEIAKERIAVERQRNSIELANLKSTINNRMILEKRTNMTQEEQLALKKKQLEIYEKEKSALLEIYKQLGLINSATEVDGVLNIDFSAKIKENEKNAIEQELININKEIDETKLNVIAIELQIDETTLKQTVEQSKQRVKKIQTELDEELKLLQEGEQERINKERNAVNFASNLFKEKLAREKEQSIKHLTEQNEREKRNLELMLKYEYITEEQYKRRETELLEKQAKKQAEIEERYRRQTLAAESIKVGGERFVKEQADIKRANEELVLYKKALEQLELEALVRPLDAEELLLLENYKNKIAELENITKQGLLNIDTFFNSMAPVLEESLTAVFSGSTKQAKDIWRAFLAEIAGYLQKKVTAMVLDLIMSPGTMKFIGGLPFPANVLALPVITATITAGVKAVTDPLLKSLLSFATGGRVDEPTIAVVGDAARLGGHNREWIFRDDQLIAVVQMATVGQTKVLADKLDRIEKAIQTQQLTATLRGEDLSIAVRRAEFARAQRTI
ncbi:MAG TPA: phage tail tape measure protein [Candidatus Kapabacteria bacterium]|nr:phage tail tape measure protein [Candidatus Kapabacteria bacterium]